MHKPRILGLSPCPCGCEVVHDRLEYPDGLRPRGVTMATELRWCAACGNAQATIGQVDETYAELEARANARWNRQPVGTGA
ncbi:MAG: hypothetical protein WC326_02025 [Candidatus Delongbacteria bacterium]